MPNFQESKLCLARYHYFLGTELFFCFLMILLYLNLIFCQAKKLEKNEVSAPQSKAPTLQSLKTVQ